MNLERVEPDINKLPIDFTDLDYALWRYDKGEDRYYYRVVDGQKVAYLSVTSFCKKSLGIGHALYKWAAELGLDAANAYAKMRADYGTMMHVEIVNIIINGGGDYDQLYRDAFDRACDLGYKFTAEQWAEDLVRDVAAFIKFLKDRNAEVKFAELPVYSPRWKVAGCIDLGVEMDWRRGRRNCIIDMKSGRKGFYVDHELQLNIYKTIWNGMFSDIWPVTHVFNWAPTDWGPKLGKEKQYWPSFKLKDQTTSVYANSVTHRLDIGLIEGWQNPPKGHFLIEGKFKLDEYNPEEHFVLESFKTELDEEEE